MAAKYLVLLQLIHIFCFSIQTSSAINCNEVIERAKNWANRGIPYSMKAYATDPNGKKYRTDCSGYVSMAWKLKSSMTTVTLPSVSRRISKNDLRKGDIIMKGGPRTPGQYGHVVIFERWANSQKTSYWAYEETPPKTVYRIITSYPYFGRSGYSPYRYKQITCGTTVAGSGNSGSGGNGGAGCSCCKGNAYGEFCGDELCGDGCLKNHIYGCNKKNAKPAIHYGVCKKGCTGSSNSRAKCNK